jgi:hypothetical protein
MRFIKKISELFDKEELRDRNEIAYLTGQLKDDISSDKLDTVNTSIESIKLDFPVLNQFRLI